MKILVVEPLAAPYEKEIEGGLESMQAVVGGYIQAIYPFEDDELALICNEEGKLLGLPFNRALVQVPHYTAAVNTVELDGEKRAVIAYPPYLADIGVIPAGKHELTVTAYITRRNCFGDIHDADERLAWQGPSAWVTGGSSWTYEYRLRRTGVLTTPVILKKD